MPGPTVQAAAELVVQKPLGPGGPPAAAPRQLGDLGDHRRATSRSRTASSPRPARCAIYNYADYIDPATVKKFQKQFSTKVEIATYNSSDEAIAKLASGAVDFDLIIGLSGSNIVDLIAHKLLKPLNRSYLPNLEKNIWARLVDPFYDRDSALHDPVRRLDGRHRLAQRQGQGGHRGHGRPVGHLLARAGLPRQGRDPRRPARRAQHADAARRDAEGTSGPTSTPRTRPWSTRRRRDLSELSAICNPKVTITDYQTLPEGKTVLHHSWSGDLLGAAFYYLPKGVPPSVLSFWGPEQNGVVQNDFFCIGKTTKNPALAHEFINFFLDEKNAYDNFVNFTGYTPPQKNIDAAALLKQGLIPKSLEQAVVRPDQFAANQELLQLSVEGQRFWDDAWSKFKVG